MQEQNGARTGLSRRSFLKTSAAVAGAAAVAELSVGALAQSACADTESGEESVESYSRSYCRGNCGGVCSMIVKVRDGHVVQVRPQDIDREYVGSRQGCVRGQFTPQRIYSPQRILHPMKRAEGSARGAGEWEQISWDEALDLLSSKMAEIEAQYGGAAMAFYTSFGGVGYLNGVNTTRNGYHPVLPYGLGMLKIARKFGMTVFGPGADLGQMYMSSILGQTFSCAADCVNSDLILIWGCNPTDACRSYWPYVIQAKNSGAKIYTIDPHYTSAAMASDEYLPIKPATDGALMLAIANYTYENGLVDPYFANGSVAPLLIKEDGSYLVGSELGIEPEVIISYPYGPEYPIPSLVDDNMVWVKSTDEEGNEAGTLVGSRAAQNPEIMGKHEVTLADGSTITVRTVWDYTYENIKQYTLEKAAEICDLPLEKVTQLAHDYATCNACTLMTYQGLAHHGNSRHNFKNISLMASITGNINKPGASISQSTLGTMAVIDSQTFSTSIPMPGPGDKATEFIPGSYMHRIVETGKWGTQDWPLKLLWICNANPLGSDSGRTDMIAAFDKIGFVVTADSNMTDSARYSDLVFPIAMAWEEDDIYATGATFIMQKVVEPLGEAKPDMDIYRGIADRLGFDDMFTKTDLEYIHEQLDTEANAAKGCTYDDYLARDGGWTGYGNYIYRSGESNSTARSQFYLPVVVPRADYGQVLEKKENIPYWETPKEAWDKDPWTGEVNETYKKYKLFGASDHNNYHGHSMFFGFQWLNELREPYVKMSYEAAAERGIENGDYVRVYNDHGECVLKAVLTKGIRTDTVLMPHGPQECDYIRGHHQSLIPSTDDPITGNSAFYDFLCEVEKYEGGKR